MKAIVFKLLSTRNRETNHALGKIVVDCSLQPASHPPFATAPSPELYFPARINEKIIGKRWQQNRCDLS